MFFHVQEISADARYDPTARTYLFTNSTLVVTRYGRPIPYTNDGRDCVVFNAFFGQHNKMTCFGSRAALCRFDRGKLAEI